MSKRVDELEQQVQDLQAALEEAVRGEAEVSRANGMVCAKLDEAEKALARTHESRDEAWKRATDLERQLAERDETIRGLAEQNVTLKASLEAMQVEDMEAGFTS